MDAMTSKKFKVEVWGHRGLGATDSLFARERNARENGPLSSRDFLAENTLPSLMGALKNVTARAVETDAVLTRDGHVVLSHSNDPKQHLITPAAHLGYDGRLISQMDLAEVQALKVGPNGHGRIVSLDQFLKAARDNPNTKSGMWLNIELKGTAGTDATNNNRQLCHAVADTIRANGAKFEQVRFSSFSASTLSLMAGLCHGSEFAPLFDRPTDQGGSVGRKIFSDNPDTYRPFDKKNVDAVGLMLGGKMTSVHPEIRSLTPDMVEHCAKLGLSIATWAWQEESPKTDPTFKQAAQKAIVLARHYDVPLALITDHARETNGLVAETLAKPRAASSPKPA
jgi:glycerophosphoryl diester phosphodiesterase